MYRGTEATIEDLYKVEGKAELVNGEIVHLPSFTLFRGFAARQITMSLVGYEKATRTGYAIGGNVGFVVIYLIGSRSVLTPRSGRAR